MYSHSVEFTLMCYSFDIALELCLEVDIRSKVLVLLITLFIVVECYISQQCIFIVFFLLCLSTAYGELTSSCYLYHIFCSNASLLATQMFSGMPFLFIHPIHKNISRCSHTCCSAGNGD